MRSFLFILRGSYGFVWQVEFILADFITNKNVWSEKIGNADVIFMNNVRYEDIQSQLNVCFNLMRFRFSYMFL